MRIFNKYAYMGAIALVGAVGFTACSSDDDLTAPQNPTFDGESVKTQFAISIPYGSKDTRMTADNTQNNNNFLGMTNVRLLSFDGEPGTVTTFSSMIPLTDIAGITSEASKKIYSDVNVPVGTDHFLFYASAPMGDDASTKFPLGSIKPTLDGKTSLNDINFTLDGVDTGTKDAETALLAVLNAVDDVANWSNGADVNADLKALHASYITMTAGSANNIKLALQNLYNTVERWVGGADASATVATGIRNAIITGGTFSVSGDAAPYTLSTSLTYPADRNLPDGAVKLKYEGGNFSYDEGTLTGLNSLDVSKVCYPAALYYFVNTDLAAYDGEVQTWPTTPSGWTTSAPWVTSAGDWDSEVSSTTRTIALKQNIEYAVANLKLTVKCTKASLADNGTTENPAVYVTVPTDGFKVTGVLIGGQPSKVDWKFAPAESGEQFDYTVYDKVVAGVNAKYDVAEGANYTLLLSNVSNAHSPVNFAIELENNSGVEFRGKDGIVPVNGKFYLVGQLDPNNNTNVGAGVADVFVPDYQTIANAKISTLKNAYNTIPDLRATKMELGLSVDLAWKEGFVFDVEIGGN